MYNSVSVPVKNESDDLLVHERTQSRPKVKVAVAIAFVVVVALVGLANTGSRAQNNVPHSSAFMESDADVIERGQVVLAGFGVKGVDSGAYMTHSKNNWDIDSNIGIFGATGLTDDEQWDFHYFSNGSYYKLIHSHDDTHWLNIIGPPGYNPSVLLATKTIYDDDDIRWNLISVSDGSSAEGTPATGANVEYYLVNVGRERCLAIHGIVTDPLNYDQLKNTVTSEEMNANNEWPSSCKLVLIDGSLSTPPNPAL